jgi:hypothetical protein
MPHAIFFHYGFAIHGTNDLARLGGPASHGCIRLHPSHAAARIALGAEQYADRDFELALTLYRRVHGANFGSGGAASRVLYGSITLWVIDEISRTGSTIQSRLNSA